MRFFLSTITLAAFASFTCADEVISPWSKALGDYVSANKVSSSEASRMFAELHISQHLAVQDLLKSKNIDPTDAAAAKAADIQPELTAAVAGASKTVLDQVAAGSTPQDLVDAQTKAAAGTDAAAAKGQEIAQKVLSARETDGFKNANEFKENKGADEPGKWRPTAPAFEPAKESNWGKVAPWVVEKEAIGKDFRMAAPAALNSEEYKKAYDQVKELGKDDSATRTEEQTQAVWFWNENAEVMWMNALDKLTADSSVPEAAKAYAVAAAAAADTRTASLENRYFYNTWRPISAIREGNGPDAPLAADADWNSLTTTLPEPEFPSGHASLGSAMVEILAPLSKDKEITITTPQGWERTFPSPQVAADEMAASRVYAGTHFASTNKASSELGTKVAKAVVSGFDEKYGGKTVAAPAKPAAGAKKDQKKNLRA